MWRSENVFLLKATEEVKRTFELQAACVIYDIGSAYEKDLCFPTK